VERRYQASYLEQLRLWVQIIERLVVEGQKRSFTQKYELFLKKLTSAVIG
jgi:hypothetical protein